MKTLILYATKYGAAREIAERIAGRLDGAVVHDIKQGGIPPLTEFDCIIVGSSIYAGSMRKEAKEFVSKNADLLREKKFGFFLSGMDADSAKKFIEANISDELLQAAKAASFLGGIFDPKKAGFLERFIMKVATKQSEYVNTIDDSEIEKFTEAMTS